jgi:hypothetical protein
MNVFRLFALGSAILLGPGHASAQVAYSQGLKSAELNWVTSGATGLVQWTDGSQVWRGSGAVARDSRLVYTCAHVIEDRGTMASPGDIRFFRLYHSYNSPDSSTGATPRSYRYFTNYSSYVRSYGGSNSKTYNIDFVILIGYSAFGTPMAYYPGNGGNAIASSKWKYTGGYPTTVEYNRRSGYYLQHRTPYFSTRGTKTYGSYYGFKDMSTGVGNSGGPVWVYDDRRRRWGLAAVLVSGSRTTSGVHVLDSAAQSMGTNAISDANVE